MMKIDGPNWLNYDSAITRVHGYDDQQKEQFVMRGLTVVVNMMSIGDRPEGEFDVLYFVRSLEALYTQKSALVSVLSGGDERWFKGS